MNRETTKSDLLFYLRDSRVPVIALKGLWGTGKTHLWNEVRNEFAPIEGNDHLYASCFGLNSIDQIKATLFQNSLGKAENAVSTAQKVSGFAIDVMEKITAKLAPGAEGAATLVGSLGGLVQSALIDKTLHSRLIVLDDLERRGEQLSVDALLGFIDLLKRSNCKVLVILNEEPLVEAQAAGWRTLKEKCFEREITLITQPEEAAKIGLSDSLDFKASVLDTLIRHSVTNIRVVQRIERVVQTIFAGVADPYGEVSLSMVPAAVLLTALNFNAVPRAPDVLVLLEEWSEWCANPFPIENSSNKMSNAVAFASSARLTRDMELLQLIWSHLKTGHRLKQEFATLFEDRRLRAQHSDAHRSAERYIEDIYLDPMMRDQDFIARAQHYRSIWIKISADKVNSIVIDLERRGATKLAKEIAEGWAAYWKATPQLWVSNLFPSDSFHPIIKEAIEEGNRRASAGPSLLQAVKTVSSKNWSHKETDTINTASEQEIIDTIKTLSRDDFAIFIYFYRQEITNPMPATRHERYFGAGTETFIRAARRLNAEQPKERIAELLRMHLGDAIDLEANSCAHPIP